jgi:hypothetical protein
MGIQTIYIPLLNEGTWVCRPTRGLRIGDLVYKVLPTENYDESDEEWEFPPGTTVECVAQTRDGEQILIAARTASAS